jgi:hypothetical protein
MKMKPYHTATSGPMRAADRLQQGQRLQRRRSARALRRTTTESGARAATSDATVLRCHLMYKGTWGSAASQRIATAPAGGERSRPAPPAHGAALLGEPQFMSMHRAGLPMAVGARAGHAAHSAAHQAARSALRRRTPPTLGRAHALD